MESPLFIGAQHIKLEETDSTNAFLQRLLETETLAEGTAVSTAFQTQGRGQRGTQWLSIWGDNMLLSVLLQPVFLRPDQQFLLSQAVALGVCYFVQSELPDKKVRIKWPNDILVEGKKICGILIENSLQANTIRNSIVGVGLNVNDLCNDLPQATSLRLEAGGAYELNTLYPRIFSCMERQYLRLRQGQYGRIKDDYLNKLYAFGEERCFHDHVRDQVIIGSISGVNAQGKLLLRTELQQLEFGLKEISFL